MTPLALPCHRPPPCHFSWDNTAQFDFWSNKRRPRSCVICLSLSQERITATWKEQGSTILNSRKQLIAAPLVQALQSTVEQDVACFHFPGHNRGKAAPSLLSRLIGLEPFCYDQPELPELDDLFSPRGAIMDAQNLAAELFGASKTWFLVGGTTCGLQASILATCSPGDIIILPRNSHISAISSLVLSGAVPKYILPEYNSCWDIAGSITKSQVENAISELETEGKRAAAVLVTSPTYHGICCNLIDITELCHSKGIPVIVDEAHGAHFGFHHGFPKTALEQGADIAVQSTHKVLCSLTQSSMLHKSGNLVDTERISRCLQMLQSTSPSYLLLSSLDAARAQLAENPETIFEEAMNLSQDVRREIRSIPGVSVLDIPSFHSGFPAMDPLRITVGVSELNISGYEADELVYEKFRVIPELVESHSLAFAINLGTRRTDVNKLISGFKDLSAKFFKVNEAKTKSDETPFVPCSDITIKLTPREAFFTKKKKMTIEECMGKICGELICPYPPGIPVLIPGEVITDKALSYLMKVKSMGAAISGAADHCLSSLIICEV